MTKVFSFSGPLTTLEGFQGSPDDLLREECHPGLCVWQD